MNQKEENEKLFRQICQEMGLPWDDTLGEAIIDGQPASEWFKTHSLFEDDDEQKGY